MAVLPADIVADILSRLSVEPLLRFRSVSKIWCALIDSDHFIKLHLRRSIDTKTNRKLLLRNQIIESITLDSLDVAETLDCPLVADLRYTIGLSSWNGLVMLWTVRDTVFIWNPSTRKCQKLPPFKRKFKGSRYSHRIYFGYDAVSDDYKVFKLEHFKYPHGFESEIQVYSLKSNTWHTIKDFPYFLCLNGYDGVLAHGALHMFVAINYEEERLDLSIAAFDLATEETRLLPLPDFGGGGNKVYMDLVALEGSLCIVAYAYQGSWSWDRYSLGVWVMKDYGADKSWNKLLSVAQLSAIGSFDKVFPLTYSNDGCEVLLLRDYEELIWFDLEHNAVRKIKELGPSTLYDAEVVVQSLVPLGSGGKTNPDEQQMKDKKKRRSHRRLNAKVTLR